MMILGLGSRIPFSILERLPMFMFSRKATSVKGTFADLRWVDNELFLLKNVLETWFSSNSYPKIGKLTRIWVVLKRIR